MTAELPIKIDHVSDTEHNKARLDRMLEEAHSALFIDMYGFMHGREGYSPDDVENLDFLVRLTCTAGLPIAEVTGYGSQIEAAGIRPMCQRIRTRHMNFGTGTRVLAEYWGISEAKVW